MLLERTLKAIRRVASGLISENKILIAEKM